MKVLAGIPVAVFCACATLSAAPRRLSWEVKEFTWVKVVPAEKGAPASEHPALLDGESLRSSLREIRFGGGEALFDAKEVDSLAKPLLEAFAVAGPGEDLILLSTARRGGGFLNPSFGVTARLFVQGGMVQVIVRETRQDFLDRYRVRHEAPEFSYGSRDAASGATLSGKGLASRRGDWVEFPAVPFQAAPSGLPGLKSAQAPETRTAPAETTEARLRALKRLRDENLITEEEYTAKRREILKSL